MAKLKATESDLLFGYCDVAMERHFYQDRFVKILEYTHPQSALPRARVLYEGDGFSHEFYIPRVNITRPIPVKSSIKFWYDGFNITARATFYKHPDIQFVGDKTPFIIEAINANGFDLLDLDELAEFMSLDLDRVTAKMQNVFLQYADDLPF